MLEAHDYCVRHFVYSIERPGSVDDAAVEADGDVGGGGEADDEEQDDADDDAESDDRREGGSSFCVGGTAARWKGRGGGDVDRSGSHLPLLCAVMLCPVPVPFFCD